MLGHTNNIGIVQNNTIIHKTSLKYTKQSYIITHQYNKTQNNVIIIQNNIITLQNNIIRHNIIL